MKEAIEKSIYYSAVFPDYYNPIIFEYTDKQSFTDIINLLETQIDVVSIFAPKQSICYNIFTYLPYYYEELMLDKVTTLFLVNRRDCCIKLVRKLNVDTDDRTAILKIDSVLSEMPKKTRYLMYPFIFAMGGIISIFGYEIIKNNIDK